jgi:hypothetical protein
MYARTFIHSNNQILLLADPIDKEILYQLWSNIGSFTLGMLGNPWVILVVIVYTIVLIRLINHIRVLDKDIAMTKTNINHIVDLIANRDDYLDDYIQATQKELRKMKIEKNE